MLGYTQWGKPRPGFNWLWHDWFKCPNCNRNVFVQWRNLSTTEDNLRCPYCNNSFVVTCSLNPPPTYFDILVGDPNPGFNWFNQDIFRCSSCGKYFHENVSELPKDQACSECMSFWTLYPHDYHQAAENRQL